MNPCPKPEKPILFKGPGYTAFRKSVYDAFKGVCSDCGGRVPLLVNGVFDPFTCAHVCHIKRRQVGGDVIGNVKLKCYGCHIIKEHGPRWSKGEG